MTAASPSSPTSALGVVGSAGAPGVTASAGGSSYGQVLKSSALIGGSTVARIALGIVRTKAMALLLGPSGVGLLGLYGSIVDLAQSVAGMGINTSGVRQIAEAAGTADATRIARTVTTLRRVAVVLGLVGALLLVALAQPIAKLSFGDSLHTAPVMLLGLAVFFGAVSAGQIALVQGMRRISDLALANILGAVYGTVFAVIIVYFWRERGVVPSMVCAAVMTATTSWWYSRKVQVESVAMRWAEIRSEVAGLLKLGFVFMATGMMALGAAYLVRIVVMRKLGVDAAGYYQAAWALGGLYVGILLQAMGADFFPRLTAVANNDAECNRLVNEQAEVSLLLAGPGVIASLAFAPLVVALFYSTSFAPAVDVLRWVCLGMMLRVVSWPMGFILLAKGAGRAFFWSELAGGVAQVGLIWVCVAAWGLNGTGIGFFLGYVVYSLLIYAVVRSLSGFKWSAVNRQVLLVHSLLIGMVMAGSYWLSPVWMMVGGASLALVAGYLGLRRICGLVPLERFPKAVRSCLVLLRFAPGVREG